MGLRLNEKVEITFKRFVPPNYKVGNKKEETDIELAEIRRIKENKYRSELRLDDIEELSSSIGIDYKNYLELVILHEVAHATVWARKYPISKWGLEYLCDMLALRYMGIKGKTSEKIMDASKVYGAFFLTSATFAKESDMEKINDFLAKNNSKLKRVEIAYMTGQTFARVVR